MRYSLDMSNSAKRSSLVLSLLVILFLSMIVAGNSLAASAGGSIGTGNHGSSCTACGGGGGGGPFKWTELKNTNVGNIQYTASLKEEFDKIRKAQSNIEGYVPTNYKSPLATSKVLDELGCYGNIGNNCPLWIEDKKSAPLRDLLFNKLHFPLFTGNFKKTLSEGITIGFNFKLWRENPSNNRFDLIFERRVGHPEHPNPNNISGWGTTAPLYGGLSAAWNADPQIKWWEGHTGSKFYANGTTAGMIGGSSAENKTCQSNWGSQGSLDRNGGRTNINGEPIKNRSVRNPDNKPSGGTWCYWEGDQIGSKAFEWGDSSGTSHLATKWGRNSNSNLPNDQFGKGGSGGKGKGLKEAIRLNWSFGEYEGRGRTMFDFKVEGAPGIFYLAQIVAIDNRQNIIPAQGKDSEVIKDQFFKAWIANKTPQPATCCIRIPDYEYDPSPPSAGLKLEAQTPLQTRETSSQTVSLGTDPVSGGDYGLDQAVFPYKTTLAHYSPQLRFSSLKGLSTQAGKTYGTNFITYGATPQKANAISLVSPDAAEGMVPNKDAQKQVQVSLLNSPSTLNPVSISDSNYSDDTYKLTWLQPTLNNPCPNSGSWALDAFNGGDNFDWRWPTDLKTCAFQGDDHSRSLRGTEYYEDNYLPPVDAWDDVISASGSWEKRWVKGITDGRNGVYNTNNPRNPNAAGWISNEYIRCANPDTNPIYADLDRCGLPFYGLVPTSTNKDQIAQGSIALNKGDNPTRGAARFVLDTNLASSDGTISPSVVNRDSGETVSMYYTPAINTVSGKYEMNFCKQGIPGRDTSIADTGPRIRRGDTTNYQFESSWTGDPNCQGYAVKWKWTQTNASCNAITSNGAGQGVQPSINTIETQSGLTQIVEPATPSGESPYNTTGNDLGSGKDPAYPTNGSVPFYGHLPGKHNMSSGLETNYSDCRESKVVGTGRRARTVTRDGYYMKGEWYIPAGKEALSGWGENNTGPRLTYTPSEYGDGDSNVYLANFKFNLRDPNILFASNGNNPNFSNAPQEIKAGDRCPQFQGKDARICWAMRASYDGYENLVWQRSWGSVEMFDGTDRSDNTKYIQVYGPKAAR